MVKEKSEQKIQIYSSLEVEWNLTRGAARLRVDPLNLIRLGPVEGM
jgi:hypothetical protein